MNDRNDITTGAPDPITELSKRRFELLVQAQELVEQQMALPDRYRYDRDGLLEALATSATRIDSLMKEVSEITNRIAAMRRSTGNESTTGSAPEERGSAD